SPGVKASARNANTADWSTEFRLDIHVYRANAAPSALAAGCGTLSRYAGCTVACDSGPSLVQIVWLTGRPSPSKIVCVRPAFWKVVIAPSADVTVYRSSQFAFSGAANCARIALPSRLVIVCSASEPSGR